MHVGKPIVLILGGYGTFGTRIAKTLAKDPYLQVIVAGRSLEKAQALVLEIKKANPKSNVHALAMNWQDFDFAQKLKLSQADIVIHSAGPFQGQNYKVAQTCISLKIHYLDLSDGREFVTHIKELDELAKENGVVVVSGASTVPGLSSVIVDTYAQRFAILREIELGIASANKIDRGDATITSILGYTGKPFQRLEKGKWKTVYGWQNLHRHYYGDNIGLRWHGNCDIPDLVLFPERYPRVNTVTFHAGLEVSFLHHVLWLMSWLSRYKLIKNWAAFHKIITRISGWFSRYGTDIGGMYIRMYGSNYRYQPLEINWQLVAERGDGPYIPIVPSLIIVRKILQGLIPAGAMPCLGMFSMEEFEQTISSWHIYYTLEEKEY